MRDRRVASRSLHLDAGVLDHLGPFVDVGAQIFVELGRRHGHRLDALLVCEVYTPPGHWSSYPPHKHDRDALPEESLLEETYYHRIDPPQGYALQRIYTDDRDLDEALVVEDRDVALVPRGYHPVGAAHGYDLYYLNVMAGPARNWIFRNDPAHDWMIRKKD